MPYSGLNPWRNTRSVGSVWPQGLRQRYRFRPTSLLLVNISTAVRQQFKAATISTLAVMLQPTSTGCFDFLVYRCAAAEVERQLSNQNFLSDVSALSPPKTQRSGVKRDPEAGLELTPVMRNEGVAAERSSRWAKLNTVLSLSDCRVELTKHLLWDQC